jgi:hypothetical protein
MSQDLLSDETSQHEEVQRIIGGLLKFEPESRIRIYKTVGTFFTFDSSPETRLSGASVQITSNSQSEQRKPRFSRSEELSPKDFLFEKQPSTDVDRVACLAYFLAHFRGTPHFKTVDVSNLNTEAAQMKFSNAAYAVANAKQAGLLVEASKGANQLSAAGERYVDALPDRVAAREILSSARPKRGRKKGSANGGKSTE